MNPINTSAAVTMKSQSCHQVNISFVQMRAFVLIVITIGLTNAATIMSKSLKQNVAYSNMSTTNVQEPVKSYVSHLAQLAPVKKSDRQFQDDTQVDLLKTSESSPHGISLTLDGSHPLQYLQHQYELQQLHQQQQQQQQQNHLQHLQQQQQSNFPYSPNALNLNRSETGASSSSSSMLPCNNHSNQKLTQVIGSRKNFQPELTAASTTSNSNTKSAEGDPTKNSDDDEDADDADDADDTTSADGNHSKQDTLSSDESVPVETQSIAEPDDGYLPGEAAPAGAVDSDYPSAQSDEADNAGNSALEQPENESAERREAEAAEAREAEAADRTALDEQQQQQREIIKAQAQSEALAIKEQQEALLRQQNLQHNMLLRRQQSDLRHQQKQLSLEEPLLAISRRMSAAPVSKTSASIAASYSKQRHKQLNRPDVVASGAMPSGYHTDDNIDQGHRSNVSPVRDGVRYMVDPNVQQTYKGNDMMPERKPRATSRPNHVANTFDDEIGVDYSVRRPQISAPNESALKNDLLTTNSRQQPINLMKFGDLLPAAQGIHGSLHAGGHHGGYYMFAHSHKKGQFDSGFKRGNKKSTISGHSSQHKSHADGHMKWKSKKGKGSHYWDYNHKDKKHGKGHGY